MIFEETNLAGVFRILPETHEDERGGFLRTYCRDEFSARGLNPTVAQCSLCYTHEQGTIRGMHYQIPPAAEAKLVRCIAGSIYDVVIDLRPTSPTYLSHYSTILSTTERVALYVPGMCAHGYQALTDGAEVLYQMSEVYKPEFARGVRYDDPTFAIDWPFVVTHVSVKDRSWPSIEPAIVSSPFAARVAHRRHFMQEVS